MRDTPAIHARARAWILARRADGLWLCGLLAFVAALLVHALHLREFDVRVPFSYESDALQYLAVFRNVFTSGWYTVAPLLGAPFVATHYDAPVPDGFFLALVLAMRPFTEDPALAFNALFIGGFFAVAASFYVSARMLQVPPPLAVIGALAYTFLPFHFLRITHLFYTIYFLPPLIVAITARMPGEGTAMSWRRWLTWRKVLLFVVAGSAGVYNAFFFCLMLAFGSAWAAIEAREMRRIVHGIAAAAIVAASTVANLAPNVLYQARAGKNPEVAQRTVLESEVYGLKLVQLLLPHATHPVKLLAVPAQRYGQVASITENHTSSLGLIGSAGFMLGLLWLLLGRGPGLTLAMRRLDAIARSNAMLFLVATIGGFGALFALLVSPQLRAWNRVSIVLAATSLLMLLLALTRWIDASTSGALRRRRMVVVVAPLAAIWAIDQGLLSAVQPAQYRAEYAADAEFVAQAAAKLPAGSMVLQLPYTEYPERPPHFMEGSYGLFRPYLHPSSLHWSYGAMRGREGDLWQRALSARPIPEQMEIASRSGFRAIYVERRAYRDHGAAVEREIAAVAGAPILERSDGHAALYRLNAGGGAPVVLMPPVQLGRGFYGWEQQPPRRWAWSNGDSVLVVTNPAGKTVDATMDLEIDVLVPRTVRIAQGARRAMELEMTPGAPRRVRVDLVLEPGRNELALTSPQPALPPGNGDPRRLAFSISPPSIRARD